jgi:hypothetical protein
VAVTRDKKSDLTPSEIEFFKLLLQQLFEGPMTKDQYEENFKKDLPSKETLEQSANGVEDYLRILEDFETYTAKDKETFSDIIFKFNESNKGTSTTQDVKPIFSITKTDDFSLEELKEAFALIAFNEYFFGETPCPRETAENYSKNFSKINRCLWACNFLTYCNTNNEQADKDIIKFYKNEKKEVNSSLLNKINSEEVPQKKEKMIENTLKSALETNKTLMTENKTFYALSSNIVSSYNKSSYFCECDSFLTSKKVFYHFGDEKDHPVDAEGAIAKNISTEICMDVALGLRTGDVEPVNLHLIQSNTLGHLADKQFANTLPPAWCYIFCDSNVAIRKLEERKRDGRSHIYFNAVARNNIHDPCYSCSFMFHNYNFNIDIYKIISLE